MHMPCVSQAVSKKSMLALHSITDTKVQWWAALHDWHSDTTIHQTSLPRQIIVMERQEASSSGVETMAITICRELGWHLGILVHLPCDLIPGCLHGLHPCHLSIHYVPWAAGLQHGLPDPRHVTPRCSPRCISKRGSKESNVTTLGRQTGASGAGV